MTCSQAHEKCESLKLVVVTDRLTQRQEINSEFIRNMFNIEDRMIQEIKNQRRAIIRNFQVGDLEQKYREIVNKIYFDGDATCMTGRQAH